MSEATRETLIRLVLVEEQALFRASLGRFLAGQPGLELVGEYDRPAEALDLLRDSQVDLVLLDFNPGSESGQALITAARHAGYSGKFLILVDGLDVKDSALALKLGISGVFRKSERPERLVDAIKLVANGAIWMDQNVIQLMADQVVAREPAWDGQTSGNLLKEREEKVLRGILGGLTNRKIGDKIGLSEGSVKAVVQRLFYKAGVRTRSQLVRAALEGSLGTTRALVEGRESRV